MLLNLKKIALVLFITVLIWVWADLALNDELPGAAATLSVDPSANPSLWVSFNNNSSAHVKMTLSGPASRIAEVKRKLKDRSLKFDFYFDAGKERMDAPGDAHSLDLLTFLQKNKDVKKLGLKVKSCEPAKLTVKVQTLVEQSLPIVCLDENRLPLPDVESINPPRVNMRVPEDWAGDRLKAMVRLTPKQIEQARLAATSARPYIELAPGKLQYTEERIEVKLSPTRQRLQDYLIPATIGFTFSANLQGKYTVKIENESVVMSTIKIKATPEAKTAYESKSFKVLLDIQDGDEKATDGVAREPIYNFPAQYVRTDEIRLDQQPMTVRFRLTPTAGVAKPAAAR